MNEFGNRSRCWHERQQVAGGLEMVVTVAPIGSQVISVAIVLPRHIWGLEFGSKFSIQSSFTPTLFGIFVL